MTFYVDHMLPQIMTHHMTHIEEPEADCKTEYKVVLLLSGM